MTIKLDTNDIDYVERINQKLVKGNDCPIIANKVGEKYYIEFTCLDRAKASNFLLWLITPNTEIQKHIEETLGISVNAINFCVGDTKKKELIEVLETFLEKLRREGEQWHD